MTHHFETRLQGDGTPFLICTRCGLTFIHDAPVADVERAQGEACVPPRFHTLDTDGVLVGHRPDTAIRKGERLLDAWQRETGMK